MKKTQAQTKTLEIEKRFLSFEVRADEKQESEEKGIVDGYAVVYDKKTDICGYFEETIKRGALDNADLKDVPLLVNHDTDTIPVARSRRNNGSSSMTLTVDEKGLKIRAELDLKNNARASELYSAIKRGDISGMSFMFTVKTDEWTDEDTDYPKRTITEIAKVYEVSAVTFPAYSDTSIGARAVDTESAKKILEKIKRNGHCEDERERLKMLIEINSNV